MIRHAAVMLILYTSRQRAVRVRVRAYAQRERMLPAITLPRARLCCFDISATPLRRRCRRFAAAMMMSAGS